MKLLKRLLSIALTITCVATAPLWSGQTMRPEVAISELDNVQYLPRSAHNSQRDEYLVVWHNSGSGSRDIYGKRLDGSGNTLASFTITTGGVYLAQPTVAYDDINDQYLVAWIRDTFGDGSDWDLWGRLIPWDGPDGTLQEFSIDVKSSDQYSPTVAFALTQREFFVVWNNDDGSSPRASQFEVSTAVKQESVAHRRWWPASKASWSVGSTSGRVRRTRTSTAGWSRTGFSRTGLSRVTPWSGRPLCRKNQNMGATSLSVAAWRYPLRVIDEYRFT